MIWGGIEGGGSKFVCAVGTGHHDIREEVRFPTTTPEETFRKACHFFDRMIAKYGSLKGLGIGSFGPVDLNPKSPKYGFITSTPKLAWRGVEFKGFFERRYGIDVSFDTDVNAAALAEGSWGAAKGLKNYVYLTIGTGVGGGGVVGGRLIHGLVHPEMGHVIIRRDKEKDPFEGACPFHKDCLEGMAAGPAIEKRWGIPGEDLSEDHEAWDLEADYIAQGLLPLLYVLSPHKIILGGGVMDQETLFPKVRKRFIHYLAGYIEHPAVKEGIDDYIVPPALGKKAGILGAFALAMGSYEL